MGVAEAGKDLFSQIPEFNALGVGLNGQCSAGVDLAYALAAHAFERKRGLHGGPVFFIKGDQEAVAGKDL